MFVDAKRYKRAELSEEQFDFLQRLVPFGKLIQDMTWEKCQLIRVYSPQGICASLVMADIILRSDWGRHVVALKENNLSLLEKTDYWKGKSVDVAGKSYRTYGSWLDYSIDLTDEMTFFERRKYEPLLSATNLDAQIDQMMLLYPEVTDPDNTTSSGRIETVIERYGLWEFDY